LVGVAAACKINKSCLVLCNSNVSVQQWKEQFEKWSTADGSIVRVFTSENKEKPNGKNIESLSYYLNLLNLLFCSILPDSCIYISTYQMIAPTDGHTAETTKVIELLKGREWGV